MRHRRIHIVGSPASGKSWLAGKLGAVTGLPVTDLDGLCWDATCGSWGVARPADERARALQRLVAQDAWIAHGTDLGWTGPALERADLVVLLTAPVWLRDVRLVTRWMSRAVRRREPGGMTAAQLASVLRRGHRWTRTESGAADEPLAPVRGKLVRCGSSEEVRGVLEGVLGLTGEDPLAARPDALG